MRWDQRLPRRVRWAVLPRLHHDRLDRLVNLFPDLRYWGMLSTYFILLFNKIKRNNFQLRSASILEQFRFRTSIWKIAPIWSLNRFNRAKIARVRLMGILKSGPRGQTATVNVTVDWKNGSVFAMNRKMGENPAQEPMCKLSAVMNTHAFLAKAVKVPRLRNDFSKNYDSHNSLDS